MALTYKHCRLSVPENIASGKVEHAAFCISGFGNGKIKSEALKVGQLSEQLEDHHTIALLRCGKGQVFIELDLWGLLKGAEGDRPPVSII